MLVDQGVLQPGLDLMKGTPMTQTRGFFSVIQFCPELDGGEYANVGILFAVTAGWCA